MPEKLYNLRALAIGFTIVLPQENQLWIFFKHEKNPELINSG
jgi:hypothetical protein